MKIIEGSGSVSKSNSCESKRPGPYGLKAPCANCPFLKDADKSIRKTLQKGRVPSIIEDLIDGTATGFACHKTLYKPSPEEWKEVVGYEGLYQVSSDGRVRNTKGLILKAILEKKGGYLKVGLTKNKKVRQFFIHVLVLTAFDKPKPPGLQCRHRNGDPADNRFENLKWGTALENGLDKRLHGKGRGCNQHLNKLTIEQVREIKMALESNEKVSLLSAKYGVSRGQIYNIKNGLSWGYLDEKPEPGEDDDGNYTASGQEMECAGAMIMLEKMGRPTQLMRIMERMGAYNPEDYDPAFHLVLEPKDLKEL